MSAVEEEDRGTMASWIVKIGERERGGSLSFLQKRGGGERPYLEEGSGQGRRRLGAEEKK